MGILVCGGSGLIGTALINQLGERYRIMSLDLNPPKVEDDRTTYHQGDIRSQEWLGKLREEEIEGVIHLAAVSRVIDAQLDPTRACDVNIRGTQVLLNYLSSLPTPPWIIYGSSREVYGEPRVFPVDETVSPDPINVYGVTKLAAEQLVKVYCARYRAKGLSLRFSNVYGGEIDHQTRVIPQFVRRALLDEDLELHGPSNSFDFTHVLDTVTGISHAIKFLEGVEEGYHGPYNICTGVSTTLDELADLVIELTNSSSKKVGTRERDYDVSHFRGSWQRANVELGYSPSVGLREGIMNYINLVQSGMVEVSG